MLFEKQVSELESYIPKLGHANPRISKSTVGWQIDHTLRVLRGVAKQLEISNPNEFKSKFNIGKTLIIATKIIPRGKVKAPQAVQTKKEITEEGVRDFLEKTKTQVSKIETLDKNSFFEHPHFGSINKKEAIKFLEIHTEHHLKIIRDMLKV